MKIDFSTELLNLDGTPLKEGDKSATLGGISASALLMPHREDESLSGEEKVKRFKLAEKVHAGGVQEVTAEEVSSLKSLIARGFTPIVVGRTWELLEAHAA